LEKRRQLTDYGKREDSLPIVVKEIIEDSLPTVGKEKIKLKEDSLTRE
jgi:hypothetical protein